ncbi:MAG: cupin domain-containing protein [Acidimicrobiaceae bacterium]|nr:cupin domain-containing protein [Acidimicrobiaceae bacterium]MXW62318.1 cupin domain-containing protein [Acidimicrobiaceae bacterium]MXW74937.1 cupin domain-containing protein [Acidimicrobiaceae bacterium]MYA73705.1 cupin domain-containing protein [Acidimicrobiaceae bacterium]MYC41234.1 cupin domain-containing protein [Acidimicrobiaceae bacterium]
MTESLRQSSSEVVVDSDDFARRVIEPVDFVADTAAFIDVRLERSAGKASYSFIGPGVSQNPDQAVNLDVPHGFNIGAASMASGVVNSQHLHFTAEVFICTKGDWRVAVGEHREQHLELGAGTIFSAPTWVFRGFENIGDHDGWMYTVLGGDDTGGIIWAPDVIRAAAETGLYLRSDYTVIDGTDGLSTNDIVQPLEPAQLVSVDRYSDQELAGRAVRQEDLKWSEQALLSNVVTGHASAMAPVIGHGMTEDRHHRAPITSAHGFSVEWLRLPPGSSTGVHRHQQNQVVILIDGSWGIAVNRDEHRLQSRPAQGSVVSLNSGAWRDLSNVGEGVAHAVVVCATDQRPVIEWDPGIVEAAQQAGWSRDAGGYIAPVELIGRPV